MKIFKRKNSKFHLVLTILICVLCASFFSFSKKDNAAKEEMVILTTPYGDMLIRLYPETPRHKENFLKLVRESFYDSTLFHRVINEFMIQGGDPDSKTAKPGEALGTGGPGYTLPAEFNDEFIHKKGVLSAARQGDAVNPNKESSGSQFYIVQGKTMAPEMLERMARQKGREVPYTSEQIETYATLGGTPHLDNDYTVFGEVIQGLDIIDSIAKQPVDRRNRPIEDIRMTMKITKQKWPPRKKK